MKYDWVALAMILAAMGVLATCVVIRPDMAIPAALGLVTTIVSALRGKAVE